LEHFRDTFLFYPDSDSDDVPSIRATLTKLDPTEYREIVYNWALNEFIIWAEESRVMSEFRDLLDDS